MHDGHEAYVNDLSTGVKETLRHLYGNFWDDFEDKIAGKVRRHFGLPVQMHKDVKVADTLAAQYEMGAIFGPKAQKAFMDLGYPPRYSKEVEHLLRPMTSEEARIALLIEFKKVGFC